MGGTCSGPEVLEASHPICSRSGARVPLMFGAAAAPSFPSTPPHPPLPALGRWGVRFARFWLESAPPSSVRRAAGVCGARVFGLGSHPSPCSPPPSSLFVLVSWFGLGFECLAVLAWLCFEVLPRFLVAFRSVCSALLRPFSCLSLSPVPLCLSGLVCWWLSPGSCSAEILVAVFVQFLPLSCTAFRLLDWYSSMRRIRLACVWQQLCFCHRALC